MKFIFWGVAILLIGYIIYYFNSQKFKDYCENQEQERNKLKKALNEYDITLDNINVILDFDIDSGGIVYTKNKRLFHIESIRGGISNTSIDGNEIHEISLNEILGIDVQVEIKEKATKRIVALTSTFDKKSKIDGVELMIITESKTISLKHKENGMNYDIGFRLFEESLTQPTNVGEVNRLKLLLEKDIKNLNGNK